MRVILFNKNFGKDIKKLLGQKYYDLPYQLFFIFKNDSKDQNPKIIQAVLPPTEISYTETPATNIIPTLSRTNSAYQDFVRLVASPVQRELRLVLIGYAGDRIKIPDENKPQELLNSLQSLKKIQEWLQDYYFSADIAYKYNTEYPELILYYAPWDRYLFVEPKSLHLTETATRKGIYTMDLSFFVYAAVEPENLKLFQAPARKKAWYERVIGSIRSARDKVRNWMSELTSKINKVIMYGTEFFNAVNDFMNLTNDAIGYLDQIVNTAEGLNNAIFRTATLPADIAVNVFNTAFKWKKQFEQIAEQWASLPKYYSSDRFRNPDDVQYIVLRTLTETKSALTQAHYAVSQLCYDLLIGIGATSVPSFQETDESIVELMKELNVKTDAYTSYTFQNPEQSIADVARELGVSEESLILLNQLEPPYISKEPIPGVKTLYPGANFIVPVYAASKIYQKAKEFKLSAIETYGIDLRVDLQNLNLKWYSWQDSSGKVYYLTYYVWGKETLYQWLNLFFEQSLNFPSQNYGLKNISFSEPLPMIIFKLKMMLLQDPRIKNVEDIKISRDGKVVQIIINELQYIQAIQT